MEEDGGLTSWSLTFLSSMGHCLDTPDIIVHIWAMPIPLSSVSLSQMITVSENSEMFSKNNAGIDVGQHIKVQAKHDKGSVHQLFQKCGCILFWMGLCSEGSRSQFGRCSWT